MDANMGELLDLCSGNFKDSQCDITQRTENGTKKDDMDELLGLCSGKFVSQGISGLNDISKCFSCFRFSL